MVFNSVTFLIFISIFLPIYFLLRKMQTPHEFDEAELLNQLKNYLPTQASPKGFIHFN